MSVCGMVFCSGNESGCILFLMLTMRILLIFANTYKRGDKAAVTDAAVALGNF